jgi:hypothetical protein
MQATSARLASGQNKGKRIDDAKDGAPGVPVAKAAGVIGSGCHSPPASSARQPSSRAPHGVAADAAAGEAAHGEGASDDDETSAGDGLWPTRLRT